jgi:hypothetical protein
MSEGEYHARLGRARLPDPEAEAARLSAAFGEAAEGVIREHGPFLKMSEAQHRALVERAEQNWAQVQEIATLVPEPTELRATLAAAGGPVTVAELGLTDEEGRLGAQFGHYLRNRFTVAKLAALLGLLDEPALLSGLWDA